MYFRKKIDPRYILNSANNTEYSYFEHGLDILTNEDINTIKKVEGVNIELIGWNSTSFTIYKSDKEVKQVIPYYHNEYETNIFIIGYYPQENIKKFGKI